MAQLFPGVFDVVLGERENIARKPDPQIVYDILSTINTEQSTPNCLYVGDSLVDANTARAAGCTLALCTWGFEKKEQLSAFVPDYLIDLPKEIVEIVHSFEK